MSIKDKAYNIIITILPIESKRYLYIRLAYLGIKNPKKYVKMINRRNVVDLLRLIKSESMESVNSRITSFDTNGMIANGEEVRANIYTINNDILSFNKITIPHFKQITVSIIIPVYNEFAHTYNCIASIIKNTQNVSYEVIVIDDNSIDETINIHHYIDNVQVIRNVENKGFIKNCNIGVSCSRGKYVHLLNNDTLVLAKWCETLVSIFESNSKAGLVGSKLIYPDGRLQEAGGIMWADGSAWNYGRLDDATLPEYNYVKTVDYLSGASIMIPKKLWDEIGGFDELFCPAYYEDSDLAFEVRYRGYDVIFQPESVIVHFEGISNGTNTNSGVKANQIINKSKFNVKWKQYLRTNQRKNGSDLFFARDRSIDKKTILIIDHCVPEWDKDAGSKTIYQYIKLLSNNNFNIKFIGDNFYKSEPYVSELQQMGVEVLCGAKYAVNWKKWMKNNGKDIDFVLLNRPHIAIKYIDVVRKYSNATILYYGHDLHFLRELREYETTKEDSLLRSSKRWKKIELELMNKSDISLYPSTIEVDFIRSIDKNINVKVLLPYMYESKELIDYEIGNRENIMFIGGFNHRPNFDAAKWIHDEILPIVKNEIPDIKFFILGSNPPTDLLRLSSNNFLVKGYVTDEELNRYYQNSRLAIVPLRYGAGIKGKVIEAMANGLPVITTSVGAEGIPNGDECFIIADSAYDIAQAIISNYNNFEQLSAMSKNGLQNIYDNYSTNNNPLIKELDRIQRNI